MIRLYTLLIFILCVGTTTVDAQTRYVDEVFTAVDRQDSIIYGANTTVLPVLFGGSPTIRPLFLNLMTPQGDTETNRPLILMFHTGNFLPKFANGQINGDINDGYVNSMAERLTKLGYVVAVVDYRKGWNPLGSQEERTNTLINAAYRGVQDANTCTRFFRKTVAGGNPYGIDGTKITAWGIGTGGYISLAAATLDQYEDVVLPKFIGSDINGDGNPDPMVIPFINGDPFALSVGVNPLTGDTLCFPNHTEAGLSSELQLAVNMGGAIGDESWIDESDPPSISFHVPTDPFAPYDEGTVIVPTTGDLVVDVVGSYRVSAANDALGNNDVWDAAIFDDAYTEAANAKNDGLEGLFPFDRPNWDLTDDGVDNAIPLEASPWEFWDEAFYSNPPVGQVTLDGPGGPCEGVPIELCNWHLISLGSNPDMSLAKATAYQDTIVGYFAPRACVALNLPCASLYIGDNVEDILSSAIVELSPNPATVEINISAESSIIQSLQIVDMNGKLMVSRDNINDNNYTLSRAGLASGLYVARIQMEDGIVTKKFVLE